MEEGKNWSKTSIARQCICCGVNLLDKSPAVLMPFVAKRVFGHDPVEITREWGLRDLRAGMAYTLCNSLQCQSCAALFLDFRFTDAQMASLYQGYRDEDYTRQREHYEPGYAAVAAHYQGRDNYINDVETWLSPYLPERPAVLDWGGGSGQNTPFLGRHSLLHVHDISDVPVVEGAERVDLSCLVSGRYDLVVCSQVLEHVPDPLALVMQMRPVLGEQTLLYLEVPHEALMREYPDNLALARHKRHWHEHVNFFSPKALHKLVARAELVVVADHLLAVDLSGRKSEVIGVLARIP